MAETPTPPRWVRIPSQVSRDVKIEGEAFAGAKGTPNQGLLVILSTDEIDGRTWRHLSVSRRSKIPSYDEIVRVRRDFFGESSPAYQVFPARAEHVNVHPNCLHLWLPVGFDPFPDPHGERAFSIGGIFAHEA